jgi:hypothetical protein
MIRFYYFNLSIEFIEDYNNFLIIFYLYRFENIFELKLCYVLVSYVIQIHILNVKYIDLFDDTVKV